MTNFFYFDQINQKQGPVTGKELRKLVAQGVIGPYTPMETDTGRKVSAGQIPRLFSDPLPTPKPSTLPVVKQEVPQRVTVPIAEATGKSSWYYYNANKEMIGPRTGQEIKQLARAGTIVPKTFVMTPDGRTGLAADVKDRKGKGLPFPSSQPIPVPMPAPVSTQVFCTNCGNPCERADACLSCGFKPTGHKKFCRQCGVGVNLGQVICIKCEAGLDGSAGRSGGSFFDAFRSTDKTKKINTYFMVFWICYAAGLVLMLPFGLIVGSVEAAGGVHPTRQEDFFKTMLPLMMMFYIGYIGTIGGAVFGCMLLYQLWKLIPRDIARTTPGKAVGFSFIPLYHFYWIFVAYKGLGEDMNKTLLRHGIQYRVNEGLGLTASILWVVSLAFSYLAGLPYVALIGTVVGLAGFVVGVFFYHSVKSGAIALLEQSQT